MLVIWLLFLVILSSCVVANYTSLPKSFPRNIPVVPLWLQIFDTLRGLPRVDIYNRRIRPLIEKHGAVAVWGRGQWTVLVTKPANLVRIFKETDGALSKAGPFPRLPGSVNGSLFGENIFNADPQLHSTFSKILKPGIMRSVAIASMKARGLELAMRLLQEQISQHSGICIRVSVWTWAVSLYGEYFLDTKIHSLEFARSSLQQILRTHNRSVIGRFDFLFPIPRLIHWKPHIMQRTGSLLRQLELDLLHLVEQRRQMPPSRDGADKIIYLLGNARDEAKISEFHYRSNHRQLFVAGHENIEATLVSAMLQLARHEDIQSRLRSVLMQDIPTDYSITDLDRVPLLLAVIHETLRLYPPLWTLTNRRSSEPFLLEPDIVIPANTLVGWHAYGIHTDPQVWGPSPHQFDPLRWGADCAAINRMVRAKQAHGVYIPFGIHSRRCPGSNFALTALKVTLCELLRSIEWNLPTKYRFMFSNVSWFSYFRSPT
jgi:unspecific monooxygenase